MEASEPPSLPFTETELHIYKPVIFAWDVIVRNIFTVHKWHAGWPWWLSVGDGDG